MANAQRMFAEIHIGARFTFDHDADSGHVWTKTGRREYSRIETKRIGTTTAPITPIAPLPDDEGEAVVMLRNLANLVDVLRKLDRIKRDGNDVIAATDLDAALTSYAAGLLNDLDDADAATIRQIVSGR
jgi:hypothetical protein